MSFDTYPQTTAQRRGITLPPVSSSRIPRSNSLFMSGRTQSLETDSPTTKVLPGARSPRRHRSLLHPCTKVRAPSIHSFRSRRSVVSSASHSPPRRTSPSPKRTRVLGKFGMAAIIGPLKMFNFKRLELNKSGSKQKAKQKAAAGIQPYDSDFDSARELLERSTGNNAFYDIDVDMDSQPLSARSFTGDLETRMEMMNIDSPTTQFATYKPFRDDSDPFATPQPSAAMSVDSAMSQQTSPLSSITNGSPGSRKKCKFVRSQEAALRSRLKTLQVLGPEASTVIAMKYGH